MLFAYRLAGDRLERLGVDADLHEAIWIDLYRPTPVQVARVGETFGIEVPTLADMEEIEVSSRLYRENGTDNMTVVLPGAQPDGNQVTGPVTFMLRTDRLLTVRHHAPRPFETFPERAQAATMGCGTPLRLMLGLVEEIVARQADLLEGAGRVLDGLAARVYGATTEALSSEELAQALRATGRQGEILARVRLGLLTIERMLSVLSLWHGETAEGRALRSLLKSLQRDIAALEIHADFLSGRVGLATDTTLGMVNLSQNTSVRMMSVVAALFLPPTLIASIYGMNFAHMPELAWPWAYPAALGLMVVSAGVTWAWFRWKGWL
jgi:magnesium transporter